MQTNSLKLFQESRYYYQGCSEGLPWLWNNQTIDTSKLTTQTELPLIYYRLRKINEKEQIPNVLTIGRIPSSS